ncbi:hypothetical protein Chor_017178 [Crotalus horridus]
MMSKPQNRAWVIIVPNSSEVQVVQKIDQLVQDEMAEAQDANRNNKCRNTESRLVQVVLTVKITTAKRLAQNVVKSHLETLQFTSDELQRFAWTLYSQEEIRTMQNTAFNTVYVNGHFSICCPAEMRGCLEILLIRMTRAFNPLNNTVLFAGKYGGMLMFKSLGCDDLISSIFELGKNLCRLQLSDEEVALFTAVVLFTPDRPWLSESKKIQKLQDKVYTALQHEIQKKNTNEDRLSKTICSLHLDKLELFRLVHPETAKNFPPLYKEVFNSEFHYSSPQES